MIRRTTRWTVMLIPQTDQRPIRFQMSAAVPKVLALLFLAVTAASVYLGYSHRQMEERIAALAALETVNADQRKQIETITQTMTQRVQETDVLLGRLRALEQEIHQLLTTNADAVGETSPAGEAVQVATASGGRGGGLDRTGDTNSLPMLGNMLPEEVRQVLFSRRRGAIMASRGDNSRTGVSGGSLQQADAVQQLMDAQIHEANARLRTLSDSKDALVNRLDYLIHRPIGFPVAGDVTDSFGQRWSPFGWGRQHHYGVDISGAYWDPIRATGNGTVVYAGWKDGGYGYTVIIDHGYGFHTLYAHMVDYDAQIGDKVARGQVIGYVGSTGLSTGPHVHYEVHENGVEVDPMKYAR